MAPLPAVKFILLAVRQISKPVVRATVSRAQQEASLTRALCISLGRFSMGITFVIEKWSAEDGTRRRKEPWGTSSKAEANEAKESEGKRLLAIPRSRSLLSRETNNEKDSSATQRFSRLFLRRPMQTAWGAFRSAYSKSIDEETLVKTGAELLVELLVYSVLAAVLYFELSTAARSAEAREASLLQRIDALERKVNELIEDHRTDAVDALEVPKHVEIAPLRRAKTK